MNTLRVAITGNIGSGKSYVCRKFSELGIPVFYSDIAAKKCHRDLDIQKQVTAAFGEVYDENGILDRKKLGAIVFNDKKQLEIINSIIHPAVQDRFNQWLANNQDSPYILYESAILFECGLENNFDLVVAVSCPTRIRIESTMARDSLTLNEVFARMQNQMEAQLKEEKSDYIIINDRIQDVVAQAKKLDNLLRKIIKRVNKDVI